MSDYGGTLTGDSFVAAYLSIRRLTPETTEKLSEVLYLATSHIFQAPNYAFQAFA